MTPLICLFAAIIGQNVEQGPAQEPKPSSSILPPLPSVARVKEMNSLIMIDPKNRSADLHQAFEFIRKEKNTSKIVFELMNGKTVTNILEMIPMVNGTMILFRLNGPQGAQLQIVPIEEIAAIYHQ